MMKIKKNQKTIKNQKIMGIVKKMKINKKNIKYIAIALLGLVLTVILIIFAVKTSTASNIADDYIQHMKDGDLNYIASVTNYNFGNGMNYDDFYRPKKGEESSDTDGSKNKTSDTETEKINIISYVMTHSEYSRSKIFTMDNSVEFDLTIKAPEMYSTLMSFLESDDLAEITEDDLYPALYKAANSSDYSEKTVHVKMVITNGNPVFYCDNGELIDALSGGLTQAYREIYAKALDDIKNYFGGNEDD